jgi:hypothetical protein
MEHFGKDSASIMAHNYALVGEEKLAKGELSEKEFLDFSRWKQGKTKKEFKKD